jgi:DNA transformation protein and related proteins
MSLTADFKIFIIEQMADFGPVTIRPMFGGAAVQHDGLTFALLDDDVLYLKVNDETRSKFEAEGLKPFSYPTKKGDMVMLGYYRAPSRCLDDADEMKAWCSTAFDVALKPRPKSQRPANPENSSWLPKCFGYRFSLCLGTSPQVIADYSNCAASEAPRTC